MKQVHSRLFLALGCVWLVSCSSYPWSEHGHEEALKRELALSSYDEAVRFAEAGNDKIALDRFNRSIKLDPRPAAYFQAAETRKRLGDKAGAARDYAAALQGAPDFQEARFALMELGAVPPSEEQIKSDTEVMDKFGAEAAQKLKKEQPVNPAETIAAVDELRDKMSKAATSRPPTPDEVRAAIFAAPAGPGGPSLPSATQPTYPQGREVILNTYPFHYGNAQRFQRNKQYEKAVDELQLALQIDPARIDARIELGDCMMKLDRLQQALFHYSSAREQFPDSPRPLFKLGNYYEAVKRTDLAREHYQRAIDMDPRYTEAMNNLAALEIREKHYAQAVELLNRVLVISPDYALAYLNLGVAKENSGDKAGAAVAYRKYIELGGEQAETVRQWITEME